MKKTNPKYKLSIPVMIISLLLFSALFTINASASPAPLSPDSMSYLAVDEQAALTPNTLYLSVVGGDHWPPYIGDLVNASFLLENNTGQEHTYDQVGVFGTKNGSEPVNLTHPSAVTIAAGGSWTFNGVFPNGFGEGTYLLTIFVVDGSGFQAIGGYEYFVVDTEAPPEETPEPTATPVPEETPIPEPSKGDPNGNGNNGKGNDDKCDVIDTVGSWIHCKLLPPMKGFTCWIIQMFNPNSNCKIKP